MIISHCHRYVYIGIPRTGSKSMNHWLIEHFDGRWIQGHHSHDVPANAADYLIFTVVRNPYDRTVSGHFAVTWDDLAPTDQEIGPCRDQAEKLHKQRAIMKSREKQTRRDPPTPTDTPLVQRIAEATALNQTDTHAINQARFIERAGIDLVLYFERLPQCLASLPFVNANRIPKFPHHPERGIRPPGDFFQWFTEEDEHVTWAYASEDFEALDYQRYASGLPQTAPHARWIRPPRQAS